MEVQLDATKVYVCALDEFDNFKTRIPKLVGIDLDQAITPQLIYVAEELGGWISDRPDDHVLHYRLAEALDTFTRHWQATKATNLSSHEIWSTNTILNLPEFMKRGKPFGSLKAQKPKPRALVLGNGPSVLREIEWLKHHWDKYTTIACWHVLPKLIAQGLTPDYVAHIDGRKPVLGFEGVPEGIQTKLLTIPPACNEFLRTFPTSQIYINFDENKHAAQAAAMALGYPTSKPCYGTVVYLQGMAAVELGCEAITLIGVDLKAENPKHQDAYQLYMDSMKHFVNEYCPDGIRLFNLSNGQKIEGFEDRYINGPDLAPSSTKCKPKRRT